MAVIASNASMVKSACDPSQAAIHKQTHNHQTQRVKQRASLFLEIQKSGPESLV